jgi:hypothetical protein
LNDNLQQRQLAQAPLDFSIPRSTDSPNPTTEKRYQDAGHHHSLPHARAPLRHLRRGPHLLQHLPHTVEQLPQDLGPSHCSADTSHREETAICQGGHEFYTRWGNASHVMHVQASPQPKVHYHPFDHQDADGRYAVLGHVKSSE